MQNLKEKVFLVIILILTVFSAGILIAFNCQNYTRERNTIENNLSRVEGREEGHIGEDPIKDLKPKEFIQNQTQDFSKIPQEQPNDDIRQKIFIDSDVYTIIFDINNNNNIVELINHTENEEKESKIKEVATSILEKSNKEHSVIGNLYFQDYAYAIRNNTLTIVDNTSTRENLRRELLVSVVIMALLEVIIIYISKKVTNWATRPAFQALDAQKQFIADASHELKTPIAVILASSEALEDDFQKKWIENIKSEAERMSKLVTNLLNLARIENNTEKEQFVDTDLSKLIEKSALTFEGLMYEKKVELETKIQEKINFKCNSDEIKQLAAILIDNAIKHSEENGKIIVSLKTEKNNIIFEVSNKGKAIPKEEQEKIFERFYRSDESRNRDENRYGLGLAIAKGIVTKHNGKISASSSDGFTTFKVVLK